MSGVKHTHGEWTGEVFEDGAFVIEGADGAILCQRSSWPSRAAESRANGYLMLSSPAMLDALKQTTATLVAVTSILARAEDAKKQPSKVVASDTMFSQMLRDFDKATSDARAVIARAEGRS